MDFEAFSSRRNLLKGGLRYAALAGLAALAVHLWHRHQQAGPDCVNQGLCRHCPALGDCRLPLGLQTKKQGATADHG